MKQITLTYEKDGKTCGGISFNIEGNIMNIFSTLVYKDYQGQGIAKKLVLMAVEYAKENNLKITATCSYVMSYFEKNPSDIYIN